MTSKEFVATLDAWSAAGGRFPDSVRSRITTREEAEAVCRALLSKHIYVLNSIKTPALHSLVAFFNFAETKATEVLRHKGLDILRRIFRDALDQPPESNPDDYAVRQRHASHAFILQILAKFRERGDAALIIEGARDRRTQNGSWSLVLDFDEKSHPEAQDIFEALREPLPDGWAGIVYLNWANNLAREQRISTHPFASDAGIARLTRYLSAPDPENHFNAECAAAALPFVHAGARAKLLDTADRHPDGDVRLEAAAARARTGSEIGAQRLAQLCLDPRLADRAIEHLNELDLSQHIPSEARDPGFRAMAEMCTWLSYPTENGRPPDESSRGTLGRLRKENARQGEPAVLAAAELRAVIARLLATGSLTDRKPASPQSIPVHYDDALGDFRLRQRGKNLAHARNHVGLAPIAVAEQDQARLGSASEREQVRIVEVRRDNRSCLQLCPGHDLGVSRAVKSEVGGMRRIVPRSVSHAAKLLDSGMSTRNLTSRVQPAAA
jgi:hypothetical protein